MKRDFQVHTNSSRANNRGERGAALVTMLLVTILLLGAGGALIMTTMMSANNSVGSTAEMQAFYVAESGMQSALNVLRGNAQPLVTATDRISFRTAVIPDISNGPDNDGVLRLAGWLPYNDRFDAASLVPVQVGAITGGYRVTVENMDPNSHIVSFETSGSINGSVAATPYQKTFGTVGGTDEVTVRYQAQALTTLSPDPNAFPLTLDSALGSFVIERPATSTQDDVVITRTPFELTITQTLPWAATTTIEGTFEGEVDTNATTLKVTFNKAAVRADGTNYALNLPSGNQVLDLTYSSPSTTTNIPARVTSPDPKRLLLKSYGFGPQGAEKRLEMMVSRAYFEFEAPAGVTIRGADDCSPLNLDTGSSGAKYYSGIDYSGVDPQRPSFAVSPCDQDDANSGIKKHDTVADPEIGLLTDDASGALAVEQPSFLDSADKARAYLNGLQAKAQSIGRYFKPGSGSSTNINDSLNSPIFTFVDGDATLQAGSGFLVVTGTLTMRGNTDFRGAILVLGDGVLIRDGGGNGDILGGITIAKFGRTSGNFMSPTFHTNGGGNSNVQYDSSWLNRGVSSAMNVSGVREF
ncbi:MAG TPA: pilus assembly PilX N-terminal domain-containing protein [Pyrinomonadaceae bacterium]|nr:pilus assembly PilX N-terminal domain-containing protein [Pyrinomonadaceae bacterium]